MRELWRWGWLAGCCVAAFGLTSLVRPPAAAPKVLTLLHQRQLYREFAAAEPSMRAAAAANFPGDAWSQDDDFHNREQALLRHVALREKVSVTELLMWLDRGMRERWPLPEGVVVRPTAAPCRPRLEY